MQKRIKKSQSFEVFKPFRLLKNLDEVTTDSAGSQNHSATKIDLSKFPELIKKKEKLKVPSWF